MDAEGMAEAVAELVLGTLSCLLFLPRRFESVGSLHSHVACSDLGPWLAQGPCFLHSGVILAARFASLAASFSAAVRAGAGGGEFVIARTELAEAEGTLEDPMVALIRPTSL